jgi:hypothetical protein
MKKARRGSVRAKQYPPRIILTQSDPQATLAERDSVKDPVWRLLGLSMAYPSLGRKVESEVALAEFIKHYQAVGAYTVVLTVRNVF